MARFSVVHVKSFARSQNIPQILQTHRDCLSSPCSFPLPPTSAYFRDPVLGSLIGRGQLVHQSSHVLEKEPKTGPFSAKNLFSFFSPLKRILKTIYFLGDGTARIERMHFLMNLSWEFLPFTPRGVFCDAEERPPKRARGSSVLATKKKGVVHLVR